MFQLDGQPPVRMMKECSGFERDKKDEQHYRRDAEDGHCKRKKPDGKKHLAEMESRGGAHVEVKICVMNIMKSPEEGNHVIDPVPPPVRIIHQWKRRDASGPPRQSDAIQQTNMPMLCPHRYRKRDWQH